MVTVEQFQMIARELPGLKAWYLYMIGRVYHQGPLDFEVLPNLQLRVTLTEEGWEWLLEEYDIYLSQETYHENVFIEHHTPQSLMSIEWVLMEHALCNGWDADVEGGRWFLHQCGIDDNGTPDYKPGELGWDHDRYVFEFWLDRLIMTGYVEFRPYYFGDTSLDEQRPIWITSLK